MGWAGVAMRGRAAHQGAASVSDGCEGGQSERFVHDYESFEFMVLAFNFAFKGYNDRFRCCGKNRRQLYSKVKDSILVQSATI